MEKKKIKNSWNIKKKSRDLILLDFNTCYRATVIKKVVVFSREWTHKLAKKENGVSRNSLTYICHWVAKKLKK